MMQLKGEEKQKNKRIYEKPEIEITVFETERICSESGIVGELFGMDGFDSN